MVALLLQQAGFTSRPPLDTLASSSGEDRPFTLAAGGAVRDKSSPAARGQLRCKPNAPRLATDKSQAYCARVYYNAGDLLTRRSADELS